ncbi:MAG: hypothetical protein ABIO70_24195 [Pseudomonadota bacterium]
MRWGGEPFWNLPVKDPDLDVDIPCGVQLQQWYRALDTPAWSAHPLPEASLLACYDPAFLRNLLYASRGYPFEKPQWKKAFAGLFPESELPFDPAWITGAEKLAVEALLEVE